MHALTHRAGVGALVLGLALLPGACGGALLPLCGLDEVVEEVRHDGFVIGGGVVDALRDKVRLRACSDTGGVEGDL